MLKLIGLGLSLEFTTLRSIAELINCDEVVIDSYTSAWFPSLDIVVQALKAMGKSVRIAKREDLEGTATKYLIDMAKSKDVCVAVPGDPMIATTHAALVVDAIKQGVEVVVVPSMSVINAIYGISCLQSYRIGKIATVVRPKNGIVYEYPLHVIRYNRERDLHTPLLLEIDLEKGYFMTPREALEILLDIQHHLKLDVLSEDDKIVIIKAFGSRTSTIVYTSIKEVLDGIAELEERTVYTIIVPARRLHPIEEECLQNIGKIVYRYSHIDIDLIKLLNILSKSANR